MEKRVKQEKESIQSLELDTKLWKTLDALSTEDICRRSLASYDSPLHCYQVQVLNDLYRVFPRDMAIYVADERKALLSIELRLLILQYLVRIKEIPLAEKWTTEKELKNGEVEPQELVVSKTLSQDPSDYKVDNLTALAAQQLEDVGVRIHPGERVPYLIRDAGSRVKEDRVRAVPLMGPEDGYDEEKYTELLLKAAEELLIPFGYDINVLSRWVDFSLKHEKGESLDWAYKNIPSGDIRCRLQKK